MDAAGFAAEQKLLLERVYAQAQAYTNIIMLAGYAGLFAIWQIAKEYVTPLSAYAAGILILVSLAFFVGMEVYGMFLRSKDYLQLARSIDNPERYLANLKTHQEAAANRALRISRYYPVVFSTTVISGGLSALIILSAFCHGLWVKFDGTISPTEASMIENILSLAAGAAIASIAGFSFVFYLKRSSSKETQRNIARSLSDELRVSADLYEQMTEYWKQNKFIWFTYLDEMIESRVDYQNARSHLPALPDPDLRARLGAYYRRTAIDIDRIRALENDRANVHNLIDRGPSELEKVKGTPEEAKVLEMVAEAALPTRLEKAHASIDFKLEEFETHRQTALQLAAKLDCI